MSNKTISSFFTAFIMSLSILRCKMVMKSTSAFLTPSPLSSRRLSSSFTRSNVFHNCHNRYGINKEQQQSSRLILQSDREASTSSWMDKNNEFVSYDSPSPSSGNRPDKGEKQRRRRNNKRKEEFNRETIDRPQQNFRENFRGTRVFVQGLPDWVNWQEVSYVL